MSQEAKPEGEPELTFIEKKWEQFMLDDDRHWLINFVLSTFDKMIPESGWVKEFGEIPSFPMYFMAVLFNAMWWTCVGYFFITSYISGRTDTFISLQKDAGDCKEVPFTLNGDFLVDSSGHWER